MLRISKNQLSILLLFLIFTIGMMIIIIIIIAYQQYLNFYTKNRIKKLLNKKVKKKRNSEFQIFDQIVKLFDNYNLQIIKFSFILLVTGISIGCELDQMHQGCRINNAQCSCGYGCMSEYRYNTLEECKLSLRGA